MLVNKVIHAMASDAAKGSARAHNDPREHVSPVSRPNGLRRPAGYFYGWCLLRHSRYASDACLLLATACDDFADLCAKWPHADCCRDAQKAARACAAACRTCVMEDAA